MKQRKLDLPEELKFENRMKWGYESPDESPKQVLLRQYGNKKAKPVEVYNFYGYSFSES